MGETWLYFASMRLDDTLLEILTSGSCTDDDAKARRDEEPYAIRLNEQHPSLSCRLGM